MSMVYVDDLLGDSIVQRRFLGISPGMFIEKIMRIIAALIQIRK